MSDIPTMGQARWVAEYVQKLERQLAAAQERIKRLEEAGDALLERLLKIEEDDGIELTEKELQAIKGWRKAKESKP